MAIIIRTDGTEENLFGLTLDNMQKAVGGNIEIIPTNDGRLMVLNEEGKLLELPLNRKATLLTRGVVAPSDLIVGDVIVANNDEID